MQCKLAFKSRSEALRGPIRLAPRRDFGGRLRFSGQVATVKCYENNPLVRQALEEQGQVRGGGVGGVG